MKGFKPLLSNSSSNPASVIPPYSPAFLKDTHTIYILIYVDDIIIAGDSPSLLQTVISKLNATFSLKQLGDLDYFLGIEVRKIAQDSLLLTWSKYIKDLLLKTNMLEACPVQTPMQSTCKLTKTGFAAVSDPSLYRSVVGA